MSSPTDKAAGHSPTPWTFQDDFVVDANGETVCVGVGVPDEDDRYAVRCVNTHDALVAALKLTRSALAVTAGIARSGESLNGNDELTVDQAMNESRAALAAAKEAAK